MSGFSRVLFGEKSRPAQAVNMTSQQMQGLQAPLAQALQSQLQNPNQYQGPYAAGLAPGEQAALGNVASAAGQVGGLDMGQSALMQQAYGSPMFQQRGILQQGMYQQPQTYQQPQALQQPFNQMNPFANPSLLQQLGLLNITQRAYGANPLAQQAQGVVGQQLGGVMNPFAGAVGMSPAEIAALGQVGQSAFGANPLTDVTNQSLMSIAGGNNPLTSRLIQSAQQPILENFSDEALRLRGLFTGAGQQVQGQGSSPFAMASARLAGGVGQALNDAALGVTNQAFNQQLQGLQMAQQQPGLQLGQQLAGLSALSLPRLIGQTGLESQQNAFNQMQANQLAGVGLADQLQGNALQRALAGFGAAGVPVQQQMGAFENAANRQLQSFEGQQGRQLQAFEGQQSRNLQGFEGAANRQFQGFEGAQSRNLQGFEGAQSRQLQAGSLLSSGDLAQQQATLNAQLQNLQAQGLPRLIEQLGIQGGLAQFNQQQQNLLQLMQLIGSLSGPNTAVLPGQQGTQGAFQQFVGGLGQGMGSMISDRRLKMDVQHAGEINGVPVYRYRYLWDAPEIRRLGVMADEVTHIKGAVSIKNGFATVDYDKVFAHA